MSEPARRLAILPPPSELPCYPCPHDAVCCSWGASLSEAEASAIETAFGIAAIVDGVDEKRTATRNGRCLFHVGGAGGGCQLHGTSMKPAVCANFPWSGPDGEPYEGDATICPEIAARQ